MSRKKRARKKQADNAGFGKIGLRSRPTVTSPDSRRGPRLFALVMPMLLVSVVAVAFLLQKIGKRKSRVLSAARQSFLSVKFVGGAVCASCHQRESAVWKGSHHQLAMQAAADHTVLGDFGRASFSNNGVTSTFFRSGPKFMVRTEGPDSALHDYEIKFTFGVFPLQQYLIEMPGGRLQALGIAWDSRPSERGGHRWFALYPSEKIAPRDPRHWTGIDQNWNYMCADCHSTNLRKNYDARTRRFTTSYSEMDVACEACHGPGSNHLTWAKEQGDRKNPDVTEGLLIALSERKGAAWTIDLATGNARRSSPRESQREIQMCARCHARRGQIYEDYVHGQPVDEDYRVALLDKDLYFPDGQIKEEDYEYGSFIQSRMFHAGVTCSDCHEPHSLKLRAEGNLVCAQCHSAQKYDSPKHHFHEVGSAGALCVECHMPTRIYMVVDPRRDHSIRIPRPDLSVQLGTPNACTNCHTDKSAKWAVHSIDKWYGHEPKGFQHFAETLGAGAAGAPGAPQSLEKLVTDPSQPAIARATALSMLTEYAPPPTEAAVRASVIDDSALVRRAVARALSNSEPGASVTALAPLFDDPVRAVRIEAAEVLAGLLPDNLPTEVATAFSRAREEYINAQKFDADRPEAHMNLGLLYARENLFGSAEAELRIALSLEPNFTPAAVNLADVYRAENRDDEGERVLRDALSQSPKDASLQHALGLLLVRKIRPAEGLHMLEEAVRNEPGNARYGYVYAIALDDAGQTRAAIETLENCVRAHPYDRDSLTALVTFAEQAGDYGRALTYAQRLGKLEPNNPQIRQILKELNDRQHR